MAVRFIFIVELRGESFPTVFPLYPDADKKFQVLVYAFTGYYLFIFSLQIP